MSKWFVIEETLENKDVRVFVLCRKCAFHYCEISDKKYFNYSNLCTLPGAQAMAQLVSQADNHFRAVSQDCEHTRPVETEEEMSRKWFVIEMPQDGMIHVYMLCGKCMTNVGTADTSEFDDVKAAESYADRLVGVDEHNVFLRIHMKDCKHTQESDMAKWYTVEELVGGGTDPKELRIHVYVTCDRCKKEPSRTLSNEHYTMEAAIAAASWLLTKDRTYLRNTEKDCPHTKYRSDGTGAAMDAIMEQAEVEDHEEVELPIIIVEVEGGNTTVTAPDRITVRVVDWDNLRDEGIKCPECGDDSLYIDASTLDDWFICNGCNHNFKWEAKA